ncbi:MAG: prepilin-type N-terminal cleavage/methylation domain-containing protein [Planctomycetota bacterium]|nr:prepilin-type N-terminal cleavage/methylation domain-containing protein [Planctomycetota bacterium]
MSSRTRHAAFTLVEMLTVVAILAIVSGALVLCLANLGESAESNIIKAELAEIRRACQVFAADMGEPPRYLAELMQPPPRSAEEIASGTRWWWRSEAERQDLLQRQRAAFDPATGRGWHGPYLQPEAGYDDSEPTEESRLVDGAAGSTLETQCSSTGRALPILISDYHSARQARDRSGRLASHYQLDRSGGVNAEIRLRFVRDPRARAAAAGNEIVSLGLGLAHD